MRLWYRYMLWVCVGRARRKKARWLATKNTVKAKEYSSYCPVNLGEDKYCDAVIEVKYYEMLLNPELPKATAKVEAKP